MRKRGQVTMFIILGIVILIIVGMLFYMFYGAVSNKSRKEVSFKSDDVNSYISTCLKSAVEGAVRYCSGNFANAGAKCPDYEKDLALRTKEDFLDCCNSREGGCDFSMFREMSIEGLNIESLEVRLSDDRKKVTANLVYPLKIAKGADTYTIGAADEPFVADYSLEESACIPIKLRSNDRALCEAEESKEIEVLGILFSFDAGDRVTVGGQCIAC